MGDYPFSHEIIEFKNHTALIVMYNYDLIGWAISKATSYCLNTMLCCNAFAILIQNSLI